MSEACHIQPPCTFHTGNRQNQTCYLINSHSLVARGGSVLCRPVLFCQSSFPAGVMTHHLLIQLHLQAHICWAGLTRTQARINGFGICLLIHLNRIHKSSLSRSLFACDYGKIQLYSWMFSFSFIWSVEPLWVDNGLTALVGRAEQISQLNEAVEDRGLSLCSSPSLYSVTPTELLREIQWPQSWEEKKTNAARRYASVNSL